MEIKMEHKQIELENELEQIRLKLEKGTDGASLSFEDAQKVMEEQSSTTATKRPKRVTKKATKK